MVFEQPTRKPSGTLMVMRSLHHLEGKDNAFFTWLQEELTVPKLISNINWVLLN